MIGLAASPNLDINYRERGSAVVGHVPVGGRGGMLSRDSLTSLIHTLSEGRGLRRLGRGRGVGHRPGLRGMKKGAREGGGEGGGHAVT